MNKNDNTKRRKQRITALTLAVSLLLGGCGKNKNENSRFKIIENDNNQLVALDDSYIDNKYIDMYYVLEVYNIISKENELYIVRFDGATVGNMGHYTDVFTNVEFSVGYFGSLFDCIKVTALSGYLVSLNLAQDEYSYGDMKNIYEVIKENYVFEKDETLRRVKTNNNRI